MQPIHACLVADVGAACQHRQGRLLPPVVALQQQAC